MPVAPAWRYWVAPTVWIILNFIASTDLLSSDHTGSLLASLLAVLHLHVSNLALANDVLRKVGHFGAYFILGGLLFRAWRVTLPERYPVTAIEGRTGRTLRAWLEPLWTLRWSVLAVFIAVLAAAFDEFHQSFVPSRTATPRDVFLDTLGAIFMQLVLMLWLMGKTRPAREPNR